MRDFGGRPGAFTSWVLENEPDEQAVCGVGGIVDQRDGVMKRQERRVCSSGAWQGVASSELDQV